MNLLQEIDQNIKLFIEAAEDILNGLDQQLMEDIEWQPQPEWRGVGGETRQSGAGAQASRANELQAKIAKIKTAYANAVRQLETAPADKKAAIQNVIDKLTALAKQYNITLSSGNERQFGLAPN